MDENGKIMFVIPLNMIWLACINHICGEHRLRHETKISENHFGFMAGWSTMEAIFLLRRLMEKYGEACRDLYMVIIDLEKVYDRVPREVMWCILK